MKLVVLGASRGTGAHAVRTALARGHQVTAFARTPERLGIQDPKLTLFPGDFHQRESLDRAIAGQDAVLVTAAPSGLKQFKANPNYFSSGTALAIDAMKAHGVRRLVVLSAFGVGESRALANFFVEKVLISFLLKLPYADHEREERLVKGSGLDWVIARPGRLTDGPARGKYVRTAKLEPIPSSIARADVADFMVMAAEKDTWIHQAVQLGG